MDIYPDLQPLVSTPAEFEASTKGKHNVLIIAGYEYNWRNERKRDGATVWECQKTNCKVKAEIDSDGNIKPVVNHLPALNAVAKRKINNSLEETAASSGNGPSKTFVANDVDDDLLSQLNTDSLSRQVRRIWKRSCQRLGVNQWFDERRSYVSTKKTLSKEAGALLQSSSQEVIDKQCRIGNFLDRYRGGILGLLELVQGISRNLAY